jgi:hypothetical protein
MGAKTPAAARPTARDALAALALIHAVRRGDARAVAAVLASADVNAVAVVLARLVPQAVRAAWVTVDQYLDQLAGPAINRDSREI